MGLLSCKLVQINNDFVTVYKNPDEGGSMHALNIKIKTSFKKLFLHQNPTTNEKMIIQMQKKHYSSVIEHDV